MDLAPQAQLAVDESAPIGAALGISVQAQLVENAAATKRQAAWNELTALVQEQDEARHRRKIRRLERIGTLTEEARNYRSKTARDAFDKIFPPEPALESIRTHGRPDLLKGDAEADLTFCLTDDDIKEILDSYDASIERVEKGVQRARLTKREREIFKMLSRNKTQEEIAERLKVSQPAVSKAVQRLKKKFATTGLEPPTCQKCGRVTYRLTRVANRYECRACATGEFDDDGFHDVYDQGEAGDRRHNGESMRLHWNE